MTLPRISARRRKRNAEAKPVRDSLKALVRRCEVCLRSREPHLLACHEIGMARGAVRRKALDKPFAILVVCLEPVWRTGELCHDTAQNEPEARQLARLLLARPSDYDLLAFLKLTRPAAMQRITQDEVDVEVERLLAIREAARG